MDGPGKDSVTILGDPITSSPINYLITPAWSNSAGMGFLRDTVSGVPSAKISFWTVRWLWRWDAVSRRISTALVLHDQWDQQHPPPLAQGSHSFTPLLHRGHTVSHLFTPGACVCIALLGRNSSGPNCPLARCFWDVRCFWKLAKSWGVLN